jgi:hypothetical protein
MLERWQSSVSVVVLFEIGLSVLPPRPVFVGTEDSSATTLLTGSLSRSKGPSNPCFRI